VLPDRPARKAVAVAAPLAVVEADRPEVLRGRAWVVPVDDIDTDMIFHNRHLAETDVAKMGQFTFGNLPGWEDFPGNAQDGDVVFVGGNFGCGSSRQQAVDCFRSLGVTALVARSFGAIYERNAVNAALPALAADWLDDEIRNGDEIEVDLATGSIRNHTTGGEIVAAPLSPVQLAIYRRGGLLRSAS
jgi:3-isopropylmalate dehydratase small subunit